MSIILTITFRSAAGSKSMMMRILLWNTVTQMRSQCGVCVCVGGGALGRPSPVVEIVFHKEIRIHEILPQLLEISNHQPEQLFRHLLQQAETTPSKSANPISG
jgi:hypothetical protein